MTSFRSLDLSSLADLLNTGNKSDSEEDDYNYSSSKSKYEYNDTKACCKAKINSELEREKQVKTYNCNRIIESSKNIWEDDEIPDDEDDEARMKGKPEYEMIYEQSVTPNDIFLQLSTKGPGTDSCECLLVKVKLPGIYSKDEVSLKISTLKLICNTRKYYLNLDLPKEVNPTKCIAKWDGTENLLIVKLLFETESKLNI